MTRRTRRIVLAAITLLLAATAVVSLGTSPVAGAPGGCTVGVVGDTYVVTWSRDPSADQYVVSRSIDGGTVWWRGRTAELRFVDSYRAGADYVVQSRAADGTKGSPVPCSGGELTCTATVSDAGVTVDWTPVVTDRYVISRSVDGGTIWWRGRTDGVTTTFDDTTRDGVLAYHVTHRLPDGTLAAAVPCDMVVDDPEPHMDAVAFGDMVTCGVAGPEQVAALLDTMPGFILGLGDFSQEEGTHEQFEECFDPVMGRHTPRIEPVPGNHEYRTPRAEPYFDYFGAAAGTIDEGWYVRTKGNWQILYLNSVCWEVGGCGADAPQQQWLADALDAAVDGRCRIAIMHHPRWSSWGPYASQDGLDPIYRLLHDAGTDLVLTGHAHHYERLEPIGPDGELDPAGGFRQITVGTGGTAPRFPDEADRHERSAVLVTGEWGVLDLDLRETSYSWRFVTVDGEVLDQGADTCLGSRNG